MKINLLKHDMNLPDILRSCSEQQLTPIFMYTSTFSGQVGQRYYITSSTDSAAAYT